MHPQSKEIWEKQILPFWLDRDKPIGQRFLGNVSISRDRSDKLIDLVGQKIQPHISITCCNLREDLLKICTFAMSEYAYYYSDDRFWDGLCDRWSISSSQAIENTLRNIARRGIKLLGLVEARNGYRYVSTLWLQSGIPYHNLEQFAQLLQELSNEYTWDNLAQDSAENLSNKILTLYERRYPQGGTLSHLLKYPEPISGRIIRSIAKISRELDANQLSPSILEDEEHRDRIIGNLNLDDGFFLRDWKAIVKILTPQVTNKRQKRDKSSEDICLYLDIEDSGNIQLILPSQSLWYDEWESLRGSQCQIAEAQLVKTIPVQGNIEISELAIDITKAEPEYSVELKTDRDDSLYTWFCEGIDEDLPCLIFNAFSGEQILVDLDNPKLTGVEQIICFTPKEINIVIDECIRSIDSYIPSSIKGWRGTEIRLVEAKGCISLQPEDKTTGRTIDWQLQENDAPRLAGIKLNLRKSSYLAIPTLWLPPCQQHGQIEIKIQDTNSKIDICSHSHMLLASEQWFDISLDKWIQRDGSYNISIDRFNWHQNFTVTPQYSVSQIGENLKPQLYINDRVMAFDDLPASYQSSHEFHAQIVEIRGLWNLEQVSLILSDRTDEKIYHDRQADREGNLKIRLSELAEFWSESSNYYCLSYQRDGDEPQPLIEAKLNVKQLEWLWVDRELAISGMKPDRPYDLSCWNLLTPNLDATKVQIPLANTELDTVNTPLDLDTGIYYLRLLDSRENVAAQIGFYCVDESPNLPTAVSGNDRLENYCYTILDNESVEDFQAAVDRLEIKFDPELVRGAIDCLSTSDRHLLPEWLDKDRLIQKLDSISAVETAASDAKSA